MDTAVALVDCQNFYASCERVFDPALRRRPVAILSNNDGCVIARSEEVKRAGIEMGAPYFKTKKALQAIGAAVLSSNYELYADMSRRVMDVIGRFALEQEEYSIDECFLALPSMARARQETLGLRIRQAARRLTGLPVRVGIGRTKTLAKLANHRAKLDLRAGTGEGVYVEPGDGDAQIAFLQSISAGEIWGIGPAYENMLTASSVTTAFGVCCLPAEWARRHLTVRGLRTVLELRGERCLPLELAPPPKKTITRSRSFPEPVSKLETLQEAVAAHASRAAEKLREAGLVARGIRAFITTKRFGKGPHHTGQTGGRLTARTSATSPLVSVARAAAKAVYRPGHGYKKAGVTLYDLSPECPEQPDLFGGPKDPREKALMAALDQINAEHGKGTVQVASAGLEQNWRMRCSRRSARYTTSWEELPVAHAGP